MPKLKNLFAALVLSLASFLPFVGANVSAAGEEKTTTITITDGIEYTIDQEGALPLVLDNTHQIQSGGTFHYESNACQ